MGGYQSTGDVSGIKGTNYCMQFMLIIYKSTFFVCVQVLGITSDGASSNRKFYRMCCPSMKIPYRTVNFYSPYDHSLFLFCDVPHLMKTTRNCWANSFGHTRSRKLWVSELLLVCMHFGIPVSFLYYVISTD